MRPHTLAEVDEGGERFEPDFRVVHPDQQPPEGQTALCAHGHTLVILHLQLQHREITLDQASADFSITHSLIVSTNFVYLRVEDREQPVVLLKLLVE